MTLGLQISPPLWPKSRPEHLSRTQKLGHLRCPGTYASMSRLLELEDFLDDLVGILLLSRRARMYYYIVLVRVDKIRRGVRSSGILSSIG